MSLFVELCVGCDGLVNVLFTLEGVAMPHIYLMFELCNASLYVSFPFERFNVWLSVLDLCDMCFNFLTVYFSHKKKSFPRTNLDYEIVALTTFPMSWHFASWKTGIIAWNWEMTLVRQQFLLWLRTWHAFLVNATISNNVLFFCAKFCTYITHCCRCTIILYKMYHTVIVPSLPTIFSSKATSKKLIGLESLQCLCETIYLI